MSQTTGKFTVLFDNGESPRRVVEKDGIFVGRLDTCEIVLDHQTVSRIHAGINFQDSNYSIVNLSSSNVLTLNGRRLAPQRGDVLADGDTIQIGPFTILVARDDDEISLTVQAQAAERVSEKPTETPAPAASAADIPEASDVLKVFWEKRTRDKEDWGTRLRPTEKPKPGKAMFNWRPTRDLRSTWRFGLFIWAFLLVGAIGAFAYFRYPGAYSPKPLASAHAVVPESSTIAVTANGNSCTTCHTPSEPLENSCVRCHQAEQFQATNTKAHEEAGITCTVCHKEHQGADFDMTASAIAACASCHNDDNKRTYNGKGVRTAHGGSYGYPVTDGVWKWKGVYREVADAIPEINASATGDKDEQARVSRQFHTIHVGRLNVPAGTKGDKRGLVSCSTCHKSFDPIDRETPRQTCAVCHTTAADPANSERDTRFGASASNCISCHVQHPYSGGRWSEFVTTDALERRKQTVANKIKQLSGQ